MTAQNLDLVNEPPHYTSGSIECIDAMIETQGVYAVISFCECNAFKYIWRYRKKNGFEDLKKARWYLNKAIELREAVADEPDAVPAKTYSEVR